MYDLYVPYLQKADLTWAKFYFFHNFLFQVFYAQKTPYGSKTLKNNYKVFRAMMSGEMQEEQC